MRLLYILPDNNIDSKFPQDLIRKIKIYLAPVVVSTLNYRSSCGTNVMLPYQKTVIVATRPTPYNLLRLHRRISRVGPFPPSQPLSRFSTQRWINCPELKQKPIIIHRDSTVPNHRFVDPQDIARWTSSFMTASSSRTEVYGAIFWDEATAPTSNKIDEHEEEAFGAGEPSSCFSILQTQKARTSHSTFNG